MDRYNQEQQTSIVRDAMNITAAIEFEENEIAKLQSEQFRARPKPPIREVLPLPAAVKPNCPKAPKTTYSYTEFVKSLLSDFFNKHKKHLILVGAIVGAIVLITVLLDMLSRGSETTSIDIILSVLYFILISIFSMIPAIPIPFLVLSYLSYAKKRKAKNVELAQSPEYLKAVADAEQEAKEKQKQAEEAVRQEQEKLDATYNAQKERYETVTIPQYEQEAMEWNNHQQRKIAVLKEDLKTNQNTLNNLYETTKLISSTYRQLWILSWLYKDMSTSDHDIRYATELLDRDRQRLATQEAGAIVRDAVGDMSNRMMQGLHAVYAEIESGNEVQAEMAGILEKTKRDMNIGTVIGTIQRHNTNKLLK